MNSLASVIKLLVATVLLLVIVTGCESTGGSSNVSGSVYYGVGYYDPWYYGDWDDVDVIVTPPDRPDTAPPRPTHPIATPPMSTPRPTPMPSIPSMPRASFRR